MEGIILGHDSMSDPTTIMACDCDLVILDEMDNATRHVVHRIKTCQLKGMVIDLNELSQRVLCDKPLRDMLIGLGIITGMHRI